jgi:hypothetical protein
VTTETDTITLTTSEFALIFEFLQREMEGDVGSIDLTTKIGVRLWRRIQEIATEQNFVPSHEIVSGLRDMPMYLDPDE